MPLYYTRFNGALNNASDGGSTNPPGWMNVTDISKRKWSLENPIRDLQGKVANLAKKTHNSRRWQKFLKLVNYLGIRHRLFYIRRRIKEDGRFDKVCGGGWFQIFVVIYQQPDKTSRVAIIYRIRVYHLQLLPRNIAWILAVFHATYIGNWLLCYCYHFESYHSPSLVLYC